MKTDLKGLDSLNTLIWAKSMGLEPFRAAQIRQWLFKKYASSFDEMTNISLNLRNQLKEGAEILCLERVEVQVSADTTEKYLFGLRDGYYIESVLIPEKDHFTLCISSQVGCAMGCLFCHTGRMGFIRNLTPSEIVDQVIQVKKNMKEPEKLTNIVFMGMGEPLANYESVLTALSNLTSDDGMNMSHKKITVSTSGIVPLIESLGRDTTVNLAVSLNAADDKTRNRLMPVNRKYNLKNLMSACRKFPLPNRRMITFEYILIGNVNDRPSDAKNLVALLRGMRAKINLIPLNPCPEPSLETPSLRDILAFQEILVDNHFTAIIRKSKGQDISAACGQLSGARNRTV